MKKKNFITVGIDFDGVLAYNPFRVIRAPITAVKRNIFGEKNTRFYVPQTPPEKLLWTILHESSIFPAQGVSLLKQLVEEEQIEAHLVTARYSFLQPHLDIWLDKHKLRNYFKTITINQNDEQPHIYKSHVIQKKSLDYFIEDNLDIVKHLDNQKIPTSVLWIYNVLDRQYPYSLKFPYLEKALKHITS
jgi:hypothetical protein